MWDWAKGARVRKNEITKKGASGSGIGRVED